RDRVALLRPAGQERASHALLGGTSRTDGPDGRVGAVDGVLRGDRQRRVPGPLQRGVLRPGPPDQRPGRMCRLGLPATHRAKRDPALMAAIFLNHAEMAALKVSLATNRPVREVAKDTVLPAIRAYISRPYPRRSHRFLNPPPGPVFMRSGDLRAGLRVIDNGDGTFDVGSSATHGGWLYGQILKDRGYDFSPPSLRARF